MMQNLIMASSPRIARGRLSNERPAQAPMTMMLVRTKCIAALCASSSQAATTVSEVGEGRRGPRVMSSAVASRRSERRKRRLPARNLLAPEWPSTRRQPMAISWATKRAIRNAEESCVTQRVAEVVDTAANSNRVAIVKRCERLVQQSSQRYSRGPCLARSHACWHELCTYRIEPSHRQGATRGSALVSSKVWQMRHGVFAGGSTFLAARLEAAGHMSPVAGKKQCETQQCASHVH
mmetsp:Transcript_40368/g.75487  ORF Transcript_40368/g.75487 Transcript_40368/m.75487 type:complete len:236 (+) Transcript_40368:1034-1741(+)